MSRISISGNTITFTWQVQDGYAGGARPHYTEFSVDYVKELIKEGDVESLSDLEDIFLEEVLADYEQIVYCGFDEEEAAEEVNLQLGLDLS